MMTRGESAIAALREVQRRRLAAPPQAQLEAELTALRERIEGGMTALMVEGDVPHSLLLYPRAEGGIGKPVIVIDDEARDAL